MNMGRLKTKPVIICACVLMGIIVLQHIGMLRGIHSLIMKNLNHQSKDNPGGNERFKSSVHSHSAKPNSQNQVNSKWGRVGMNKVGDQHSPRHTGEVFPNHHGNSQVGSRGHSKLKNPSEPFIGKPSSKNGRGPHWEHAEEQRQLDALEDPNVKYNRVLNDSTSWGKSQEDYLSGIRKRLYSHLNSKLMFPHTPNKRKSNMTSAFTGDRKQGLTLKQNNSLQSLPGLPSMQFHGSKWLSGGKTVNDSNKLVSVVAKLAPTQGSSSQEAHLPGNYGSKHGSKRKGTAQDSRLGLGKFDLKPTAIGPRPARPNRNQEPFSTIAHSYNISSQTANTGASQVSPVRAPVPMVSPQDRKLPLATKANGTFSSKMFPSPGKQPTNRTTWQNAYDRPGSQQLQPNPSKLGKMDSIERKLNELTQLIATNKSVSGQLKQLKAIIGKLSIETNRKGLRLGPGFTSMNTTLKKPGPHANFSVSKGDRKDNSGTLSHFSVNAVQETAPLSPQTKVRLRAQAVAHFEDFPQTKFFTKQQASVPLTVIIHLRLSLDSVTTQSILSAIAYTDPIERQAIVITYSSTPANANTVEKLKANLNPYMPLLKFFPVETTSSFEIKMAALKQSAVRNGPAGAALVMDDTVVLNPNTVGSLTYHLANSTFVQPSFDRLVPQGIYMREKNPRISDQYVTDPKLHQACISADKRFQEYTTEWPLDVVALRQPIVSDRMFLVNISDLLCLTALTKSASRKITGFGEIGIQAVLCGRGVTKIRDTVAMVNKPGAIENPVALNKALQVEMQTNREKRKSCTGDPASTCKQVSVYVEEFRFPAEKASQNEPGRPIH